MRYAAGTKVSVERSQMELVALLKKHGASGFAFGEQGGAACIVFAMGGRHVRFELKTPTVEELLARGAKEKPRVGRRYWYMLGQTEREKWAKEQVAQVERQRWRSLILVCKAKLELIADGIGSVETEFLAHVVLPDGRLVGEWLAPQLRAAYEGGDMPKLLPGARH